MLYKIFLLICLVAILPFESQAQPDTEQSAISYQNHQSCQGELVLEPNIGRRKFK